MTTFTRLLLLFGIAAITTGCGSDSPSGGNGGGTPPPAANTAPEASDDTLTVQTNADNALDVLDNDSDADDDALEITEFTEPEFGTLTLTDGVLTYTSNPNYTGSDSFSYTISDGEDTATADVALTVQATMSVRGRVVDAPIAGASVSITIGDQTYTATADADGYYTVDVTFTDGSSLLTINAQGAEENDQAYVDLLSMLPSLDALFAAAGEDGVLERSEASGTNVTNVTTASYILSTEANNGAPPANAEELLAAQGAVNPTTLLELAAVIKLIIDDPDYDLPEGSESITDFASNEEAYNTFVDEVEANDPGALDEMVDQILADEDLVESNTEIPRFYIRTAPTKPGYIAQGSAGFVFNDDGTGEALSASFTEEGTNTTYTWTIDNAGFIDMDFASPLISVSYPSIYDATDDATIIGAYEALNQSQAEATYSRDGLRFKVISKGQFNDVVQINETFTVTYTPIEYDGVTYQIPSETLDVDTPASFINGDQIVFTDLEPADVIGTIAMPLIADFDASADYRIFAFDYVTINADNTFSAEISGETGTWDISDDSSLNLYYGDAQSNVELVEYSNGVWGAIVGGETEAGSVVADYTWVAKMEEGAAFDDEALITAADEVWFAAINAWALSSWDAATDQPRVDSFYGWQYQDDSVGYFMQIGCEEFQEFGYCSYTTTDTETETTNFVYSDQIQWDVDDNEVLRNYRKEICDSFELFYDCRGRNWYPLVTDFENDILVVLEHSEFNYSGDPEAPRNLWFPPRLNYLQKISIPDGLANPRYPDTGSAIVNAFGGRNAVTLQRSTRRSFLNTDPVPRPIE